MCCVCRGLTSRHYWPAYYWTLITWLLTKDCLDHSFLQIGAFYAIKKSVSRQNQRNMTVLPVEVYWHIWMHIVKTRVTVVSITIVMFACFFPTIIRRKFSSSTTVGPLLANTTLTVIRFFGWCLNVHWYTSVHVSSTNTGNYIQMMNALRAIAFDVVECLSQLFDYYLFSVRCMQLFHKLL